MNVVTDCISQPKEMSRMRMCSCGKGAAWLTGGDLRKRLDDSRCFLCFGGYQKY